MNTNSQSTAGAVSCQQRGVTLIELLITLAFGLVLILATMSVYMANNQTFRQVENLSRLNENARIAFELLGREFREAGATPCGNSLISNILNNPSVVNWGVGQRVITPYGKTQVMPTRAFGTGAAQRVNGTDALIVSSGNQDSGLTVAVHNPVTASIELNKIGPGFVPNEIVLACDFRFATIFQITNDPTNSKILEHKQTASTTSGNCTSVLFKAGQQVSCASANGESIVGASIIKISTVSWFVANNGRGGRSLYRIVGNNTPEEIVENVSNMQIEYLVAEAVDLEPFDYVISTNYDTTVPRPLGVTSGTYDWWPTRFNIIAARVTLTLQTPGQTGTDGQAISRNVTTVFSLRNHKY